MVFDKEQLERIRHAVGELRDNALDVAQASSAEIARVPADYRASAHNLLHYLSLRQHDLRRLEEQLAALGLSSFGSIEAHTQASLDAVLAALAALTGDNVAAPTTVAPVSVLDGPRIIEERTRALLGETPDDRPVRIMVTMPTEAATDSGLCESLLRAGMDVARINCAHDAPEIWLTMIQKLNDAAKEVGKPCLILADLQGPKLRTGPIEMTTGVVKIRPRHKGQHKTKTPARVLLTATGTELTTDFGADPLFVLDRKILEKLKAGDELRLTDVRGKCRTLDIVERRDGRCLATAKRSIHVTAGTPVRVRKKLSGKVQRTIRAKSSIRLFPGDTLIVTGPGQTGHRARLDALGNMTGPAMISCSLAPAMSSVKPGDPVWFDDGKIGGRITECDDQRFVVKIHHARYRGTLLRPGKGINLPRSDLDMAALTEQDRINLEILAPHTDLIGMSFIRRAQDVIDLQKSLNRYTANRPGIVLKIENRRAFDNLASILLASLRSPPVGVMVARGDLAVEVGFERLAEVQDEILWLCEAAHVPVVWATQVLEDLAQTGTPSRAEVTDAASGGRAECVMLNKGPHIVEAVGFLSNVLSRMATHQNKRFARLRRLSVSELETDPDSS